MNRPRIPAKLQALVLKEFNYLCAVCGRPRPHVHHIDENSKNNTAQNLIPLCPNHHLLDAHNPTSPIPSDQMSIFREFRDPFILYPQFLPVLKRLRFLLEPNISNFIFDVLEANANDLIAFLKSFEYGDYYSQRVAKEIGWTERNWPSNVNRNRNSNAAEAAYAIIEASRRQEEARERYREVLRTGGPVVIELVIEALRFQNWLYPAQYRDA